MSGKRKTTTEVDENNGPDVAPEAADELVPGWLALLVLILMLAVVGVGGWIIRGAILDQDSSTPEEFAVEDWENAVEEDPSDLDNRLSLGFAYQQAEEYDKAVEQYDYILAEDASNTAAIYNKAVIYMMIGQPKAAEELYWNVLEVAPDHALAAKGLAEYYIGKQQYKSALVALEAVIEVRPELADLQYLTGVCYERLGRTTDAIARYEAALTYAPDMIEAKDALTALGVQ